jgi:hypothetical protein
MFVVRRVAGVNIGGAVTHQQRFKGLVDEHGVATARVQLASAVEQLLIHCRAQSCASHAINMALASRQIKFTSRLTAADTTAKLKSGGSRTMVTVDVVRTVALSLPRTEEALVRDQVKFRVRRIVYVALSRDERSMGFASPKDERAALVAAQPEKFFMPIPSDLRYNWVRVWLDAIDLTEMRELVVDAWRMVVPKRVAAEYLGDHP